MYHCVEVRQPAQHLVVLKIEMADTVIYQLLVDEFLVLWCLYEFGEDSEEDDRNWFTEQSRGCS